MENIKAKFFALYLGQKVQYPNLEGKLTANKLTGISYDYISVDYTRKRNGCSGEDLSFKSNGHHNSDALHACLLLRTIDQLTDAQLLEIAVLRGYRKDHLDVVEGKELKEIIKENRLYLSTFDYKEVRACIIDYLRLNGFITPFTYLDNNTPTTLSVDDILGMGWVVLTPPTLK